MHDSSRWDLQTKECQLQEKHTCWLRGVLGESLFISEISFSIAFSSLTAICSRFLASTSVFAFANFFSPFFFLSFFLKKSSRSAILLHRLFSRNVYNNREVNPSAKRPGPSQEQLSGSQSETSLLMPPGLPQQLAPPTLPLRLHVTVQRDVRARCAVDQFLPREDCERGKVRSSGAQHAADEMTAMSENLSQKKSVDQDFAVLLDNGKLII